VRIYRRVCCLWLVVLTGCDLASLDVYPCEEPDPLVSLSVFSPFTEGGHCTPSGDAPRGRVVCC
jgi:hypothetical protein